MDEWPVQADRYQLVWIPGCPHAHKVIITRKLLGLDKVIQLATMGVFRTEKGWVFSEDPEEVDPVRGLHFLDDKYVKKDPQFNDMPTVPIIVDSTTGKGVTNDHLYMSAYLETAWKDYHKEKAPNLYPKELRTEIEVLNEFLYERVNQGVYRVGFACSQEIYEKELAVLFEALELLDKRLENKRFLFGDYLTNSDICLYPILARFDAAYYPIFKTNKNRLVDFENLWPYAQDLYQTEGFRDTTDFELLKTYYQLAPHLKPLWKNIHAISAKELDADRWEQPHNREILSHTPNDKLLVENTF